MFFRLSRVLIVVLAITACMENTVDQDDLCASQEGLTVVCGTQAPEDLEWLPDGSGVIISEYANFGAAEGRISLLELEGKKLTHLYDSSFAPAYNSSYLWGDPNCQQPDYFSPHGISLAQRPSGRWQLLVVNHDQEESIEFFELMQTEGQWNLVWRGCVEADDNGLFNDVAATSNGFYVSRFVDRGSKLSVLKEYFLKGKRGVIKRWSFDKGWEVLEGTRTTMPNGVLWNPQHNELVVNEWATNKIVIYNAKGEKKREFNLPGSFFEDAVADKIFSSGKAFPDNVSWDEKQTHYLSVVKGGGFFDTALCSSRQSTLCKVPFVVLSIKPNSDELRIRFMSDGQFFGGGTTAIEKGGQFYIGSFVGDRLLIADENN